MLNWLAKTWGVTPQHPSPEALLKEQALNAAGFGNEASPLNMEALVWQQINAHRTQISLQLLEIHPSLNRIATDHSLWMSQNGVSHARWDGTRLPSIRNQGFQIAGENVGGGESYTWELETLLNQFVSGWIDSPSHKQVLETPQFTHTGIGLFICKCADDPDRIKLFATQIFAGF